MFHPKLQFDARCISKGEFLNLLLSSTDFSDLPRNFQMTRNELMGYIYLFCEWFLNLTNTFFSAVLANRCVGFSCQTHHFKIFETTLNTVICQELAQPKLI